MATIEADATPVRYEGSAGMRVMLWTITDRPIVRRVRECADAAAIGALHAEVLAEARATGRSFFTSLRVRSGRKPRGFDKLEAGLVVKHDAGDPVEAAA